ncbi:Ercc6l2 [Phodopus roborovskii]|uniref:DNA excision repair protein ERCC-6-like 2 n=1 Tax=Phodopus roborovskii TaxID=109678 RepID=A0AAU9ZNZ8_PHORO|nr:Ercc6l2 [Phodopus roborovskii]
MPREIRRGYGWCPGERCLAPSSDNMKLCEASIKSITVDENGEPCAVVLYPDFQEKKVPLQRLQEVKSTKDCSRSFIFDDEDLEKPYFPDRKIPSLADAFKLSEDGDSIPYTINRYLRDYQREGAQFLYRHYIQGRGCILGDDMGLGKTIQVISFLAAVLRKKGTREDIENNMPEFLLKSMKKEPSSTAQKMFLIVAPLSVLYNWKDELDTWGYFRVTVLHGSKKDNGLLRLKQRKCEIALTTYETLRLCLEDLNSLDWSAVIVDEAHRIKNPKAQVTEVMKALSCKVRIGLTGTILQNNMKELWCVVDWAVPGLLGSQSHFKKQFSDPVEHGQRHTATKRELATGRKAMHRLAKKMSGCFLRRTKSLIKGQLPKKEDRMVYCSLTEFQKAVYQTVLETEDVALILRSSQPCTCGSGRKRRNCCYKTNSRGDRVRTLCLSYLTVLQKVANHVALLQTASTSKHQETLIKRICDQVFSRFPDFVQKSKDAAFETLSDPKYSGKMKVLQQLLNHFRKQRDKVLLFSFSIKLLDVLQQYCMASGLEFRRLDGSTKSEERLKIVKEFNSTKDVNICLVSTMAGGLGLNFVGANIVILFDPTWNPANDLQAIDRAYRIGQCRDVKVLRLISLGTVEEIMYLRQVYKQQLHCVVVGSENAKRYFEAVQGSKEHRGELFGVHNLFKLRAQGSCLTRDILEREGQVEAGIMTATTWLKGGPSGQELEAPRDPDCEEPAEVCELFPDFSDDESVGCPLGETAEHKVSGSSRAPGSSAQRTLLQCGFSKLFEANCKSGQGGDGNAASGDESSDEQPACLSTEAKQAACQKTRDPVCTSEHRKSENIQNPNEKCGFDKSKKTLEQNVSSESDDEWKCHSTAGLHGMGQSDTESEDSDVIFPTQYPAHNNRIHVKLLLGGSEDSESENPMKINCVDGRQNGGRNERISKPLSPENMTLKPVRKRKLIDDISDESDDIDIFPKSRIREQRATTSLKLKRKKKSKKELYKSPTTGKYPKQGCATDGDCSSQVIEDFSSSDDNLSVSHLSFSKLSHRAETVKDEISLFPKMPGTDKKNSTFIPRKTASFLNERVASQEQMCDSMDKILVTLTKKGQPPSDGSISSPLCVSHPVSQKKKYACRTNQTTFIIGETPKGIRRKQFEEMASYYKLSVQEFARQVTSSTSEERQRMLRDFYSLQHPEVKEFFVNSASEVIRSVHKEEDRGKNKEKEKESLLKGRPSSDNTLSCSDSTNKMSQVYNQKLCKGKSIRFQNHGSHGKETKITKPSVSFTQEIDGERNDHTPENTVTFFCPNSKSETPNTEVESPLGHQRNLTGVCTSRDRPQGEESPVSERTPGEGLLGDTSILNDLFKSRGEGLTQRSRDVLSGPVAKAKQRPKDFWDILSEQNDDSLSKLTDLTVIETLCTKAPRSTASKRKGEPEASLWKANEKFLWKTFNSDADESMASTERE